MQHSLEKPVQPIKVIHIDDEEFVLDIVGQMIRANPAFRDVSVQSFQNRDEAWRVLSHTDPDILITDLCNDNVPGQTPNACWNGFDMLSILAARRVKYPIIVLSGSLSIEGYEYRAIQCAGMEVNVTLLQKPITPGILHLELAKHLGFGIESGNQYNRNNMEIFPETFEFQIGGYCGISHNVKHIGLGKLAYRCAFTQYQWGEPIILNPASAQWEQFLREMDEIGLWKWEGDYPSTGTIDGTFWCLKLRIKDKSLISQGKNAYPSGCDNAGEPTGEFLLFLKAVQKLTGKDIR